MARNSSGTYTLPTAPPAANPVVSGDTISSEWANGTLSDLATEMTDALSRSGKGGMTAPLRTDDGTAAAPSHSFTSETGTGWFRNAAGDLRAAILGTYRLALTATGAVVNGALETVGALKTAGILNFLATTITGNQITSAATNQANVVGLTINTNNSLTQGKVVSIQNNTVEAVGVAFDGTTTLTRLKRGSSSLVVSTTSTGLASRNAITYAQVTNATLSFTATGQPVRVGLQQDGSASGSRIGLAVGVDANGTASFAIVRTGTNPVVGAATIAIYEITGVLATDPVTWIPSSVLSFVDQPPAGVHTYELQYKTSSTNIVAYVYYAKLYVHDL